MKKKLTKTIALALCTITALATVACGTKKTSESNSIVESSGEDFVASTTVAEEDSVSAEIESIINEYGENVETSVDDEGNLVIVEDVTDESGETVTDATGEKVTTAEVATTAKGETVTVATNKTEQTTTKSGTTSTSTTASKEQTTTKAQTTTTQQATTKAPTTQSTTQATTQTPTQQATTQASTESKIPSNWRVIEYTKDFSPYDSTETTLKPESQETRTMYTDGTWVFGYCNAGDFINYSSFSGWYIWAYLGAESEVTMPEYIDGLKISVALDTFTNNQIVTKVTVPASYEIFNAGRRSIISTYIVLGDNTDVAGSAFDSRAYDSRTDTEYDVATRAVYCSRTTYERFKGDGITFNGKNVYSLDGQTKFRDWTDNVGWD